MPGKTQVLQFVSISRLERQEGRLREEAATTAASYEAQLSVMSEHLARCIFMNDKPTIGHFSSKYGNSIFQYEFSTGRAGG